MLKPKLHFQRFEFKYLISFAQFQEIKSFLKRYVELDGFAKKTESGFYEVVSLYYDSPKFYYYQEKIDGVKKRKKVRLRTYIFNGQFVDYSFFEIKRKHDAIILKDRFLLDDEDYQKLKINNNLLKSKLNKNDDTKKTIEEFHWEWGRRQLRPKVLVVYNREPYLGKFNKNFRVTFDYHIKSKAASDLFDQGNDYSKVLKDQVVMEVKFNGKLPYYIQQIINKYNLARVPYSKYCRGLESSYYLPALNISKSALLNFNEILDINK